MQKDIVKTQIFKMKVFFRLNGCGGRLKAIAFELIGLKDLV